MNNKLIAPSPYLLNLMIASAEAKFESAREQARLRKEAREEEREVRAQVRAARGRYYAWLQLGS